MPIAAALVVSEPQRAIFTEMFRKANTNQHELGIPPHMSFAVFDEVDTSLVSDAIGRFVQSREAPQVFISSIAMFPMEQPVVYALPTVNAALLDAQRCFHRELGDLSSKCWDYYKPDIWSPHLALDNTDSLADALRVISVAYETGLRGTCRFGKMVLMEFPPLETIVEYEFAHGDQA